MLYSDAIAAICAVFIIAVSKLGYLYIWHIYLVNAIIGAANAFQSPAASVAIGFMVPKGKLSKVSGMNSFSSSLISAVAPMLAASIISFGGLTIVIIVDLASFFIAFIALLFIIKIPENAEPHTRQNSSILESIKDGFSFLRRDRGLLNIILSMAMLNFFSRLTYENILSPMILARSGGNDQTLGIVSSILGIGGIIGGALVSIIQLPRNKIRTIYLSAGFSFIAGDILMGLGQGVILWCIAGLTASVPIPFITAAQNVILYDRIPENLQGRVFAARNATQFCAIPLGILLGGFLADSVFDPFMANHSPLSLFLQTLVGQGAGSGMAVMFLCTGILGSVSCLLWRRNRYIRKVEFLMNENSSV